MCLIENPSPTAPYSTPDGAGPTLQHTVRTCKWRATAKRRKEERGRKAEKNPNIRWIVYAEVHAGVRSL